MESREARDIIISAIVLALIFASVTADSNASILDMIPITLIAVSLGFVLHEMGHRYFSRKYGCYAEFRMWKYGLFLAVIFSFFGVVFAAPGAVVIHPRMDLWGNQIPLTKKKMGIISLSGPMMNILLALVFISFRLAFPSVLFFGQDLFSFGAWINIWLALFNLLPFGPLDGTKILRWDKRVWAGTFIAAIVLFAATFFI